MNDVVEVPYVHDYTVWVRFQDGTCGEVDIAPSFKGPVFEPLRDLELFKQVRVDPEIGTIVWPNGADVAPETLHDGAVKRRRAMCSMPNEFPRENDDDEL